LSALTESVQLTSGAPSEVVIRIAKRIVNAIVSTDGRELKSSAISPRESGGSWSNQDDFLHCTIVGLLAAKTGRQDRCLKLQVMI
jgi:hypothetical protein